jgi:nitroreductase
MRQSRAMSDVASSSLEHLATLIRGRRTVAEFFPQRPPETAVLAAIDLARWAPNHKLTQPWRFHLLGEWTTAEIIALNARLIAAKSGAAAAAAKEQKWRAIPGWLAVTCQRAADPLRAREDYAACCCAVQNLLLALWAQGIASKWSTGEVTRDAAFLPLLELDPSLHDVVGLIWYGYPVRLGESRRLAAPEITSRLP